MNELLPYFERELLLLRHGAAEFATRYPGPASRLKIMRDTCTDPHVERTIQATALLSARVSKALEDAYPQFTESLLEVVFPHYLRPYPSCAIVQPSSGGTAIPRGTELRSMPVDGVPCHFRTCYDIQQLPVCLSEARFVPVLTAPHSIRIPQNCSTGLSFVVEITDPQRDLDSLGEKRLRIYLDGDPSLAAIARDTLCGRTAAAYIEAETGEWTELPAVPLASVGFADDDALVPFSPRSHPAYRLLVEYFTFPEKFNFIDLDLAMIAAAAPANCRRLSLHLAVADMRSDSNDARLLAALSADNFLLGCSPVVNLFRKTAVPIAITHQRADYPLLPDAERARAYDIHTVDAVLVLDRREHGVVQTEYRPFYSLKHGEGVDKQGHYYVVRRDDTVDLISAGHEHKISFVNIDFDPADCENATASIELTCNNRDLPTRLECGQPAGDLVPTIDQNKRCPVRFVRRPTAPYRFASTPGMHWRLISYLSLNFHSLVQDGLDGFREMLTLFDLAHSPTAQRQIQAVVGLDHLRTTAWMRDKHGASLVHGIEVRITVDEDGFAGSGLHLFARVIDQFLGLYVQINSFTQLVIVSSRSTKELIRCQPRNGDLHLL
jgi:type VI secretion system protein ImpG